jgi:hypothetical protein
MENTSSANNAINPNDVLCGRGGLTNSHVGNRNYRLVVGEYQQEYLNARKKEKKEIAIRIVTRINDSGGRFLKRSADSSVWSEVTQKKAIEKTSQALREGLDVRHKIVRPEKVIDYNSTMDVTNPRKRPKLVEGLVMDSPKINGTIGVVGDVPDLIQDESPSLAFTPLFTFGGVSEIECDNVHGI